MADESQNPSGANTTAMVEEAPPPAYPGKGFRIGEYVVDDVLGHGSMATVFLARDATGHEVALKIFQEGPGVSATMLERFRREAEASKKLRRHPHILTIYSTGKEGPYHYIAMESIRRSKTLEAALESTPMSQKAIVEIIVKIARALQYAHSKNIVHRDVKPTNIMIDEFGEPLLADFGVAELIDWPSCTLTGALTGTPLYMSPEQARGERVGAASDIYSLGVVLYEALAGVLPYSAQHRSRVKDVLEAVKNEPPRRPRLFRRDISPDLEAVMLKALEKDPRDRYPDAEAFAQDLERALAGKRVSAHHFSPLDRARFFARRHEQALLAGSVAAALGVGLNVYFRAELIEARLEGLLHLAHLRHAEYALARVTNGALPASGAPRAWNDIRMARRMMDAGEWAAAREGFETAAASSLSAGDRRTAAIAQIEAARCEVLLGRRAEARAIYAQILRNPDAPASVTGLAQLEYLMLALLDGDRDAALQVLIEHEPPAHGPLGEAIRCLAGDLPAAELLRGIPWMPRDFRNDAYLVAAVRQHLDGDRREAQRNLRQAARASTPRNEWPGPFARLTGSSGWGDLLR